MDFQEWIFQEWIFSKVDISRVDIFQENIKTSALFNCFASLSGTERSRSCVKSSVNREVGIMSSILLPDTRTATFTGPPLSPEV